MKNANVGDPVASFVGLENFRAALESDVFYTALRYSIVFTVVAAIFNFFFSSRRRHTRWLNVTGVQTWLFRSSHYETFRTWHSTLYREVEATSVTPFAS